MPFTTIRTIFRGYVARLSAATRPQIAKILDRALATIPVPVLVDDEIMPRVRVLLGAVCDGSKLRHADTPVVILTLRNGFEVVGPHAYLDAAEVIHDEIVWDRPMHQFVGEAVGTHRPSATEGERAIAAAEGGDSPKPTRIRFLDVRPESRNDLILRSRWSHWHNIPHGGFGG